ncbi:hypothetical protein CAEBREN_13262 [Caenorhabditis brenneri]|uniref:MRG domain-containing protein n=1 Tax=Caenorhabditis brenneri TaxID=135651 RepID=G0MR01_CAEBE|nr:hypothetical protein CAEBREN_13262 [Caenorhabditis brenneri]
MFRVGEKLVAIGSDDCPYASKVVAIEEIDGVKNYIIHFDGWNDRHDEAVAFGEEEGKLFKGSLEDFVAENRSSLSADCLKIVDKKIEAARKKKENEEKKKNRESILPIPSSSSIEERWHWKLDIPSGLKKIISEDQRLIKEGRLSKIPSQISVEEIFNQYLESLKIDRKGPKTGDEQLTQHHIEMVIDYFNLYFRSKILNKAEKCQFKELRKEQRRGQSKFLPSEHYGLIHLARSFAVIPDALELKLEDEKHFKNITPVVHNFMEWLDNNKEMFYNKVRSYLKC